MTTLEIVLGILFVIGPGWLAHRLLRTPQQAIFPLLIVIGKIIFTDPASHARMLYLAWLVVLAAILVTRTRPAAPPDSSFR